jgi:hypothetical protein
MFPKAERILICGRIGDPLNVPVPGSSHWHCEDCGAGVWTSPESRREIETNGTPVACVECYAAHRDAGNPTILVRQEPSPPSRWEFSADLSRPEVL